MASLLLQLLTIIMDNFLLMFHSKKKILKGHQQEHLSCVEKEHKQT